MKRSLLFLVLLSLGGCELLASYRAVSVEHVDVGLPADGLIVDGSGVAEAMVPDAAPADLAADGSPAPDISSPAQDTGIVPDLDYCSALEVHFKELVAQQNGCLNDAECSLGTTLDNCGCDVPLSQVASAELDNVSTEQLAKCRVYCLLCPYGQPVCVGGHCQATL